MLKENKSEWYNWFLIQKIEVENFGDFWPKFKGKIYILFTVLQMWGHATSHLRQLVGIALND